MNSKITYRQQFTRCGKKRCHKCQEGAGHGPYWYAYWSENGRTVSKYIGTYLPEHLQAAASQASSSTATQKSTPSLRIYLLGQFRIERSCNGEWQAIDSRNWHRRRARALLGCLLSSPGRRAGREQIMEQLWPDLDINVAANRLNGAVHELRQILEPNIERPAASRLLRLERDILELADSSQIWVDAEAFEALVKEAFATDDPRRAETLLEEASSLYRGNYLIEELYSEWAAPRRDALQRAWVSMLLKLAQLQTGQKAHVQAIDTLDRLRTTDPTNETALQHLMILLTYLDRRGEALQVYRKHVTMLKRDYESEPLPETVQLYESLLRKDIAHLPSLVKPPSPQEQELSPSPPPPAPPAFEQDRQPFTRPSFQLGRHNQSPLIGRQSELEIMHQVLLATEAGTDKVVQTLTGQALSRPLSQQHTYSSRPSRASFILLKGESGIGKTRLAEELSLQAYTRGWTVAWSRSYEQEIAIPYRPWIELLRTLLQGVNDIAMLQDMTSSAKENSLLAPTPSFKLERLSAFLPELAPQTPSQRLSQHTLHEQERIHLWEATLGLLTAISSIQPLLLILDDLHWADDSTIELLIYLIHHLQNQPILFIGTCRDGELVPQHKLRTLIQDLHREQVITTISVHPLTQAQIGTLVAHLPQEMIECIQEQAYGNPFFAEELARYIGAIPANEEEAHLPEYLEQKTKAPSSYPHHQQTPRLPRTQDSLPEAIAAVLERRLNKLSADCRQLLSKAAVLGGSFTFNQLLPMASESTEDSVLDLLEEALQAGLLTEEGRGAHITYHFWHPLIISHLYARLSAARRAQLHRKAAEAIKAAHDPASDETKIAATIFYHLSHGGGSPQQVAYYAELAGHHAYALSAYAEAQHYYLQALLALMNKAGDNTAYTAIQHLSDISPLDLAQAATLDPPYACRLLEYIAECSLTQGNFEEARSLYQCILDYRTNTSNQRMQADEKAGRRHFQQQEAQAQALLWREIGNTWSYTGEYALAYECYERGRTIMYNAGITTGAAWACLQIEYGEMFRLAGSYQKARQHLEDALSMLRQIVQPAQGDAPSHTQPATLARRRHSQLTRIERALLGDQFEIAYAYERLGIVEASIGRFNEAQANMQVALSIYEQGELVSATARVCGNLGAVHILRGEHDAARSYMHRALSLAERIGDLPNMAFITINLGEAAHHAGDLKEAESWFKRSLELGERVNDRERLSWCYADLAAVQKDLGLLQEAQQNILQAISIGRAIKNQRCIHHALVILGDIRTTQAMLQIIDMANSRSPLDKLKNYLARAKKTLQRAITLEDMEIENIIKGKVLLAMVYFLQGDFYTADILAQQTLREALEQGAILSAGHIYRLLGSIVAEQSHYETAEEYFHQATNIFQERALRLDYARTLQQHGMTLTHYAQSPISMPPSENFPDKDTAYQRGMDELKKAQEIFTLCHARVDLTYLQSTLTHTQQVSV
jgi:predicted ATPase/DNA-binding SARP family transcriptional activator